MPYTKRNPSAGPIRALRHPDDEFGFDWVPDAEDQLWDALEALEDRNDAHPLVRALLRRGLLPRAVVRAAYWLWLGDPLPPRPQKLSPTDQATLEATLAYKRTPSKRNAGMRAGPRWKAKRVLDEQPPEQPGRWRKQGVTEKMLLGVADNDGGRQCRRIREYLDAMEFYPSTEPPDFMRGDVDKGKESIRRASKNRPRS